MEARSSCIKNTMKLAKLIIYIFYCFFLFLNISYAQHTSVIQLKEGEYLESQYVKRVLGHRSPYYAATAKKNDFFPIVFSVAYENNALQFGGGNFHEGGLDFMVDANGKVTFSEALQGIAKQRKSAMVFQWVDEKNFNLKIGKEIKQYQWVGDAEIWIAKKILIGKYQTKEKKQIEFTEKIMQLPTGNYSYRIGLDPIIPYDYILIKKTPEAQQMKLYRFQLIGKKILLYKGDDENDFIKPSKIAWEARKM